MQTIKEAGYKFIGWASNRGGAIFEDDSGAREIWFPNKGHASYGFTWRGTDWEFARSLPPFVDVNTEEGPGGEVKLSFQIRVF